MCLSRTRGFSLVELLVAVVIGLIGSIIIFQVYSVFEGQKRSIASGGDASSSLVIAANSVEQAGRHAGYGLNFTSHLGCTAAGWYEQANAAADSGTPFTVRLLPVDMIRDGSGNVTSLIFTRSNSDTSYSVTRIKPGFPMADSEDVIHVENMYGFNKGDVLVLASKQTDGSSVITCAVTEVRDLLLPDDNPPGNTIPNRVVHTRGSYTKVEQPGVTFYTKYNKQGGLATWTTPPPASPVKPDPVPAIPNNTVAAAQFKFNKLTYIMNVGQAKGGTLGLTQSTFTLNNGQLLENGSPVGDGIVFMAAQFGTAPTTTATTVVYTNTMPDASTDQETWLRLRTVRVALIARVGQYDKDYQVCATPPCTLTVWNTANPTNLPATYTIPDSDIHYRHKIVQLVIPLRNFFWRPS